MPLESSVGRRFRVGLVVLIALLFLVFGVLMVGKRRHLFTAKLPYHTQFDSAAGLVSGNPVRLNGVTVGNVLEVNLSPDPADQRVDVRYEVDRKVAPRLRTGTRASIKTIGLLGDKYVELAGGTAQEPVVPPEGEIKPAPGAGLEKLLEGSGDLLTDLGAIARSLKNILGRTEEGKGFLGQLTSDGERRGAGHRDVRVVATDVQCLQATLLGRASEVGDRSGLVARDDDDADVHVQPPTWIGALDTPRVGTSWL